MQSFQVFQNQHCPGRILRVNHNGLKALIFKALDCGFGLGKCLNIDT